MQISNIKTQFNTILIKKTVRSFSAVIEWISLNCQMRRKSDGCSVRTCYLLMHSCQLSLWSFFLQMPVDGGWFTWPREHIAFIHALCKHWHHTVHSWYFSAPASPASAFRLKPKPDLKPLARSKQRQVVGTSLVKALKPFELPKLCRTDEVQDVQIVKSRSVL